MRKPFCLSSSGTIWIVCKCLQIDSLNVPNKSSSRRSSASNGRTDSPKAKSSITQKYRALKSPSSSTVSGTYEMPSEWILQDSRWPSFTASYSTANDIAKPQTADSKTNWSFLSFKPKSALTHGKHEASDRPSWRRAIHFSCSSVEERRKTDEEAKIR